jgi:N-acetylneuraminic acid mutarotase
VVILSGATSIEKYDLRANKWSHVANMSGRRLQFGVAVVDGRLYVVGGRDGLKTLNTVECYDISTKTWTSLPPMSTHRHGLGTYLLHIKLLLRTVVTIWHLFSFCLMQEAHLYVIFRLL